MAYTNAPSGLSIARDGMKFTLSWKVADSDYTDGQELQYRTNLIDWTVVSLEAGATSRTVTLDAGNYYPTTDDILTSVSFRVRGKRTATTKDDVTTYYDWSAWSELSFPIYVPKNASVSQELDESLDNKTTFTWTVVSETQNHQPTVNVEWQTMLLHNCTETDGSKLKWASSQPEWNTGTASLNSSKAFTEDSTTLAGGSYTRWFRIRARGAAGNSEWRYSKHVYARPYQSEVRETSSAETATTTTVRVVWASQTDAAHPIDRTAIEWLIETPAAGLVAPTGASWTEATGVADTGGTDSVRFVIDGKVGEDTCLWVRVNNTHDRNTILGDPELVRVGYLAAPSNLSVTNIDSTNYQVDIACTNNSDVPDSKLAVIYRRDGKSVLCGIIGSTGSITDLQCPAWTDSSKVGFSVYAFQGTYTSELRDSGVTVYAISENMTSSKIGYNTSIPQAPATVSVTVGKLRTDAIVHWTWTWSTANIAELSWSESPWAWESTEPPSTYQVDDPDATKWRVRGLTPGKTYYFRVRLGQTGDETVWSPYSDTIEVGMFTTPDKPTIQLSDELVDANGKFSVSWTYHSDDNIGQESAEVCAYPNVGVLPIEAMWPKRVVARAKSAQAVNVKAENWTRGAGYYVRVRVTSKAGLVSAWSEPAMIGVVGELGIDTVAASLSSEIITDSSGVSRVQSSLTALPLTVTATPGAPAGGTTTVIIQRAEDYTQVRPDGKVVTNYEGEAVAIKSVNGNGQIAIRLKDLIGRLDDGAKYVLRVVASAPPSTPAEVDIPFEVHWDQQAHVPNAATTEILTGNAIKITPTSSSVISSTRCDIYRLSADGAELIIENGTFGVPYVDPFPAIGETAGYRVVYKSQYGDYITASEKFAWKDTQAGLDLDENIIDFNGEQVRLKYNMGLSNSWQKGFTQTVYLGGSVQGDWDLSIKRSGSVSATAVTVEDQDTIDALRRLAKWTGICHVRTVDGSSYAADVQVSETRSYKTAGNAAEFDLKITKVDSEVPDGITYAEWIG